MKLEKKIVPKDNKFCVMSQDGSRSFGCYSTMPKAEARMKEVEAFKNMSKS